MSRKILKQQRMKLMTTSMTTTTISNNTSEEICFGVWNPEEERISFGQ